ncbi:NUDIX domain-containing protein [Virgibacillus pantothenticus]
MAGEDSLQGACREVAEELGLQLNREKGKLLQREVREVYHHDIWLFPANVTVEELVLQPEEVVDAKWVTEEAYR